MTKMNTATSIHRLMEADRADGVTQPLLKHATRPKLVKSAVIYADDIDCPRCGLFVPCERHAWSA